MCIVARLLKKLGLQNSIYAGEKVQEICYTTW